MKKFNKLVFKFIYLIIRYIVSVIIDYLKYETVTSVNIERKNEMNFPAIYICTSKKNLNRIHLFRLFQLGEIDVKSVGFETDYGIFKCIMLNTGLNLTNHKVPLISTKGIGKDAAIKFCIYFSDDHQTFIHFGKNNLLPNYKSMKTLKITQGDHNDISLSKLSDVNLGEPYNNCLKNTKPTNTFAIESYKHVSKFGFDYSYQTPPG